MPTHIVVFDIQKKYPEATLVEEPVARMVNSSGGIALPVDVQNLFLGGVSSYMRRGLGEGVTLDGAMAKRVCPMIMGIQPGLGRVYWASRLQATTREHPSSGYLRLVSDTQPGTNMCGLSAVDNVCIDLSHLGEPDSEGGWCVRGHSAVNFNSPGYIALALHGYGAGVKVMWGAISYGK